MIVWGINFSFIKMVFLYYYARVTMQHCSLVEFLVFRFHLCALFMSNFEGILSATCKIFVLFMCIHL